MDKRIVVLACLTVLTSGPAPAQEAVRLKSAVVALADDPAVRTAFEDSAAKFREHNYDAVTSYDIVGEVTRLDEAVESREQGMARLQDLIVRNLDEARPMLRQRLGLAPLP